MTDVVNDFLTSFKSKAEADGGEEHKVEVRRGIIDRYGQNENGAYQDIFNCNIVGE